MFHSTNADVSATNMVPSEQAQLDLILPLLGEFLLSSIFSLFAAAQSAASFADASIDGAIAAGSPDFSLQPPPASFPPVGDPLLEILSPGLRLPFSRA